MVRRHDAVRLLTRILTSCLGLASVTPACSAPLFGITASSLLGEGPSFAPPDEDPFYIPPASIRKDKPGTVYRSRKAANPGSGRTGTQILFRTNDAHHSPTTTVTTILQNEKSSPQYLVAYNMYQDAAAPQCAPSYCFNTNSVQLFCPDGDEQLKTFMKYDWTVIVTDFEGNNSAFSVGHQAGYQILDGYRAAINFLRLPKDVIIGGSGYSGGAIGTGWSAALHATYAPELNIRALAFGGTPANVTSTMIKVNGGMWAVSNSQAYHRCACIDCPMAPCLRSLQGLAVSGMAGHIAAYPELQPLYKRVATKKGAAVLSKAKQHCAVWDLVHFAFVDLLSTDFQSLGPELLYQPLVAKYLQLSVMGSNATETPKQPSVFMYLLWIWTWSTNE
ncbi:BZ3500_MvSof-1268-A1-R1_Chr2-1g04611 [Microbotryum saponariae]|uniref:triacylglycerol lipase n=1 Tax=Microbotryum saponariae TaxID=289078 RepID=A0A2X0K811_9BASI|nr:BZ3500_MvSof-1268-A1-R1_Chr2-1g04611 [Microbotryum saponariae]SCZ92131.1 BZ3501_MvSof-1269-A2-R1_Chr2-1g04267 [Microbotryum saponariae]